MVSGGGVCPGTSPGPGRPGGASPVQGLLSWSTKDRLKTRGVPLVSGSTGMCPRSGSVPRRVVESTGRAAAARVAWEPRVSVSRLYSLASLETDLRESPAIGRRLGSRTPRGPLVPFRWGAPTTMVCRVEEDPGDLRGSRPPGKGPRSSVEDLSLVCSRLGQVRATSQDEMDARARARTRTWVSERGNSWVLKEGSRQGKTPRSRGGGQAGVRDGVAGRGSRVACVVGVLVVVVVALSAVAALLGPTPVCRRHSYPRSPAEGLSEGRARGRSGG